jgi:thiamine-phosphate pyrophosphorylase
MPRRQTATPRIWLVADDRFGADPWKAVQKLPKGSGVLVLYRGLKTGERARLLAKLRRIARARQLVVVDEAAGEAARVHDLRELRRAGLARTPLLFVSPVFPTRSHPDRPPLKRQRLAALVRLSTVPVIALGGMNGLRFRTVERMGLRGWAGIDAWLCR